MSGDVSSRSVKTSSVRKRKFKVSEMEDTSARIVGESEMEGPFWFEQSGYRFVKGQKFHYGIQRRERQLLKEIVKSDFYTSDVLKRVVIPLNNERSKTPRLRAFDWAVTNFSKERPELHVVSGQILDPNLDYQNELKKHHRLLFDPFRRGTHVFFEIDGETHRSTVGQLSFIKWCLEHKVDKYVEENLADIRKHMSERTKRKQDHTKRRELTKIPRRMVRGAVTEIMQIK